MGRKSRIDTELSPEDLAEFRCLLGEGRLTIDDLTDWLEARGYEISRSAVGRAAKKQAIVAARLRESRAVTEALSRDLGEAALQGKQGRLLVELGRGIAFDYVTNKEEADAKDIMMFGKALSEFARAARLDQDFEEKVEVRARKLAAEMAAEKAAEKAGEMVEKAGPSAGLSADTIAKLKADFLGMA
jgi:hypothetical protein